VHAPPSATARFDALRLTHHTVARRRGKRKFCCRWFLSLLIVAGGAGTGILLAFVLPTALSVPSDALSQIYVSAFGGWVFNQFGFGM
jgi:hypothetical protein